MGNLTQFNLADIPSTPHSQSRKNSFNSKVDPDRARDALNAIPPDICHEDWVKVGMSFHAADGTFEDWDAWSAPAPSYKAQTCRTTWDSFKTSPGGIGPRTLFATANTYGWNGGRTVTTTPRPAPAKTAPKPVEQPKTYRPGMAPDEVWSRCESDTASHPYVMAKGAAEAPLEALRVVPAGDALVIAGQSMVGYLVVPAYAPNGALQSLQFIPPPGTGKKLNLPGAGMAEGSFTVGALVPGDVVYIVEGIGQAWACWQATGAAAVACFGAGNMGKVAAELRQRDPSARLVLVADVGKEVDAKKIAAEIDGAVAVMPEGEDSNFDANDFAKREGHEALKLLLDAVVEPPKKALHPLAQYHDLDMTPLAPRWVIPGFIGHGVVVMAGAHGAGKTTALLPLAMVAAGMHHKDDPLAPAHWRHVVYILEDIEQANRIIAGIVGFGDLGLDPDVVRQRLHIVEARRLEPSYVAQVGKIYRQQFTRTVDGVDILPLVVVDTKAAVLELENENDNSEASKAMASLKQGFDGLPVWLIGHVSKQAMERSDVASMSLRGGSAYEADANQVLYLVKEKDGSRYLVRGKTRFEAKWAELKIETGWATTMARDEFGGSEDVTMRWGIATPPEKSRKEAQEQAKAQADKETAAALRDQVRNHIEMAWQTGHPLNREAVKSKSGRNRNAVTDVMVNLLAEGWLYEVPVPAKERTNSSRASFLVNFTTPEHDAYMRDGSLPAHKLVIPASWKKPLAPSVSEPADATPAPEVENSVIGEADHAQ